MFFYVNENVTNNLVEKLRTSTYLKNRAFFSLYLRLKSEHWNPEERYTEKSEEVLVPIYTSYNEDRKNINRYLTLFSFDDLLELIQPHIADIRFFA